MAKTLDYGRPPPRKEDRLSTLAVYIVLISVVFFSSLLYVGAFDSRAPTYTPATLVLAATILVVVALETTCLYGIALAAFLLGIVLMLPAVGIARVLFRAGEPAVGEFFGCVFGITWFATASGLHFRWFRVLCRDKRQ